MTTWSPGLTLVTPSPTSSITPAPSWPRTMGGIPMSVPFCTDRSEWHTPDAPIRTLTSPALGESSSTSWISRGCSSPVRMAAFGIGALLLRLLRSCGASWGFSSSRMPELCASLAVLAFGRLHGVSEDDRRQQGDRTQHKGGDDQGDQCRRIARREADEEGDDGHGDAAVADPLAALAEAVDASAALPNRIVVAHDGSQPRRSRSSRSSTRSRSREK